MSEPIRINKDKVLLALTRPPMMLGIPGEAFMAILIVTALTGMIGRSLLYWLVFPVLFLLVRAVVKYDHNAFFVLNLGFKTKSRVGLNQRWWGGASYSPLRLRRTWSWRR